MSQLSELTERVVQFRDERDWAQFHTPSHLASALSVEAAELLELFLWRSDDEIATWMDEGGASALRGEMADVLIFLLLLSHECGVPLDEALQDKLRENAQKYPVDLARGSPRKYTELRNADAKE